MEFGREAVSPNAGGGPSGEERLEVEDAPEEGVRDEGLL